MFLLPVSSVLKIIAPSRKVLPLAHVGELGQPVFGLAKKNISSGQQDSARY